MHSSNSNSGSNSNGGYDWSAGMSNRAVAAYGSGLLPAAKCAAALRVEGIRVDATFIRRHFTASEWHHTSKKFNATDFFSPSEIAAEINASEHLQARVAEYALEIKAAKSAAREEATGYLADVTITEFERIVLNRFGKLGGWKPVFRTLKNVTVKPAGLAFVEISGEGRKKIGDKLEILRLSPEEIRRRKNLAIAAKRKVTIARRKAEAEAGQAMQSALAAHRAPRLLALPAPARRFEPIENRGVNAIRAELGRGYAFDSVMRGHVFPIAHRVAVKTLGFEAARVEVAALAQNCSK